MSFESDVFTLSQLTEPTAEIKPVKENPQREESDGQTEKDFLRRLKEVLDQLARRDDMQGYRFSIELHEGSQWVILSDSQGALVARLTPEHCFEMAEKSHGEGLLVEVQC